jgi:hypothetical protein
VVRVDKLVGWDLQARGRKGEEDGGTKHEIEVDTSRDE